jgi:hypothetical protein
LLEQTAEFGNGDREQPHRGRKSVVVLHEVNFNPVFAQYIFFEDFRKKTASIDMTNQLEQLDAGDIGVQDLQKSRCLLGAPEIDIRRRIPGGCGLKW